jgi:hypothetical protein
VTSGLLHNTLCFALQVKVAEHVLTGHKVAIKILNRRKIQQMEMEEKGVLSSCPPWCGLKGQP